MNEYHERFMLRAIELAERGINEDAGGPFGSVIVRDDLVIAEGWNSVTSSNDPTAHAEIMAIREACRKLNSFQLENCVVYSSCEPCPMCLGAIYWARPKMLVFAGTREDAAGAGFDDQFIYDELARPLENRGIRTLSIMRHESQRVFRLWDEKEDKIEY